jgi:hypothetical protein
VNFLRFIYVFNIEVAKYLEEKGLKKLNEVTIDGKKAFCFENRKDVYLGRYEKNELLLTNKLFF